MNAPPHFSVPKPVIHWMTPRERQLLGLVMRGLCNKQIADHLQIRNSTVGNALSGLFRKVGVSSRSELILWAFQHRRDAELGTVREQGIHQEGCACGAEYCILLHALGEAA